MPEQRFPSEPLSTPLGQNHLIASQAHCKWFRDRLNLSTSRGMWWSLGVPARICTKIGTVVTYRHPELVCKYFNMYIKISRFILVLLYLDSKSKVQDSKSNLLDSKTKLQEREIKLLKSEVKLNREILIYMLK